MVRMRRPVRRPLRRDAGGKPCGRMTWPGSRLNRRTVQRVGAGGQSVLLPPGSPSRLNVPGSCVRAARDASRLIASISCHRDDDRSWSLLQHCRQTSRRWADQTAHAGRNLGAEPSMALRACAARLCSGSCGAARLEVLLRVALGGAGLRQRVGEGEAVQRLSWFAERRCQSPPGYG